MSSTEHAMGRKAWRNRDRRLASGFCLLASALGMLLATGCFSFRREAPRPGRTTLESPLVVLPATLIGDHLVIEAKWDRSGPYRFLIDTGSVTALVTPDFAKRYADKKAPTPAAPRVPVQSSDGTVTHLPVATLRSIKLGDARFQNIPARVHDCAAISAHLGVKIDSILGFSFFRETLLTLDYPRQRVLLQPRSPAPLVPGVTIPFNNSSKVPLIPIKLEDTTLIALIDSGSDSVLSLNPVGLQPKITTDPRPGPTVATLTGDRTPLITRLAEDVMIGSFSLEKPLIQITDELSWIGGGVLKHFTVTFDQEHNQVTFHRDSTEPIRFPPSRHPGLSFNKSPAYWRVAGVIPGSTAAAADVQTGDLVTHINREPVASWDFRRYEQLIASAEEITFTFLHGSRERDVVVKVQALVP